jgi:2-polyprenyl-3-methyl-5-hydroxy-6-metoxy-1,4-benzoquinol methylase
VYDGDFLSVQLPRYDLVLMIDVLEHFDRDDGFASLRKATSVGAEVLISTPRRPRPQGAVKGNPFERHRSRWTAADFAGYAWRPSSTHHSLIGILSGGPGEPGP